jgi:hypothetical protein
VAASELRAGVPLSDEARLEELRARVTRRFRSLAATKHTLRSDLRAVSDWRMQARRHPYWAAGLSAGMGLLSVFLLRGRGRVASRVLGLVATAVVRQLSRRVSRELSAAR